MHQQQTSSNHQSHQQHQMTPHQLHQKHNQSNAADFFPKHLPADLSDFAKKDAYNFVASPNLLQSNVHHTQQQQQQSHHSHRQQQMHDHHLAGKPSNNYNSQMHNFTGNPVYSNGGHSGPNSGNYHRDQFNITENPSMMSGRDNYNIRENYAEQQIRNNQFNNNNYAMRGEAEPLLTSAGGSQPIARVSFI